MTKPIIDRAMTFVGVCIASVIIAQLIVFVMCVYGFWGIVEIVL